MNKEEIRQYMGPDAIDSVDTVRGLSSKLLRDFVQNVPRIGIGSESNVDDHIHALLDLLAWHHYLVTHGDKPEHRVQLVIGRGPHTGAALPAVRTLRWTHAGSPEIEVLVESEINSGQFETDTGEAPTFNGARPTEYAGYLDGWYSITPTGIASEILDRSPDARRLRLYPQLSTPPVAEKWSLRLDGLQIGELGPSGGYLRVGGGELSSQVAVQTWHQINGGGEALSVTESTLDVAIGRISELVRGLERVDGGLLDHGVPEHALESAVVRGEIQVTIGARELCTLGDEQAKVAYGSQIPTLWAPDGRPWYLDALLRDCAVPWAIEMKVKAGGGYGAYLRHAIGQAVLYRHFLRTATPYQAWFDALGLDRQAVRAAVLYPQPTPEVQRKIASRIGNLLLTAAAFDVQVVTVDAGWLQ